MSEARRFGYVSDYVVYNLGITLSPTLRAVYDRYNDIFNANKPKFDYFVEYSANLDLYKACSAGNNVRCRVNNVVEIRSGMERMVCYRDGMGSTRS